MQFSPPSALIYFIKDIRLFLLKIIKNSNRFIPTANNIELHLFCQGVFLKLKAVLYRQGNVPV